MAEKCKDCCSRLFCMSVAEVNGEDFETMANKKDCRKRFFTNADRIRAMSDEELADCIYQDVLGVVCRTRQKRNDSCSEYMCRDCLLEWLKQPAEE